MKCIIGLGIFLLLAFQSHAFSVDFSGSIDVDIDPSEYEHFVRDKTDSEPANTVKFLFREIMQNSSEISAAQVYIESLLGQENISGEVKKELLIAASAPLGTVDNIIDQINEIIELTSDSHIQDSGEEISSVLESSQEPINGILVELVGTEPQMENVKNSYQEWKEKLGKAMEAMDSFNENVKKYIQANLSEEKEQLIKNLIFPLHYDFVYLMKINEKMDEILAIEDFGTEELERLARAVDHALNVVLNSVSYDITETWFLVDGSMEVTCKSILSDSFLSKSLLTATQTVMMYDPGMESEDTLTAIKENYAKYKEISGPIVTAMEELYNTLKE